jgi:shikimate kinase
VDIDLFPPNNVILIGMPAVGKSTLGVVLAKRMGFAFTDTDLLIQTGEGESLSNIIEKTGLEKFCDIEAQYIQKLSTKRTVIATGGSVVYRPGAMAHLNNLGCTVFLDIGLTPLARRLKEMDARGVVRLPGQTIEQLYAQRRPLYQRFAQITVDCTHCTPDAAVRKVLGALK